MAKMVSSVVIARPVAKVFEFFLDLDVNASKVDPTAGSVVKAPAGPTGPGTTFQFRRQSLGRTRETTTRFTAVEPNYRIEFEAEIGPMRPQCDLTFAETASRTEVTFRGDSHAPGALALLNPLLNRKGQQVWSRRLARVKEVLESESP